jgi:hypothetical protein
MGTVLRFILATLLGDLFAGSLRHVLVTPRRHMKARGYCAPSALLGASRKRCARTSDKPGQLYRTAPVKPSCPPSCMK